MGANQVVDVMVPHEVTRGAQLSTAHLDFMIETLAMVCGVRRCVVKI